MRFRMDGHVLWKDLKYSIQLAFGRNDFEPANQSPIFDAFIEYVAYRDFNLRVGQYFVPFDRARTVREFALQMIDRPQIIRELTMDRDVGLMISSTDLFGTDVLGYHLFVGNGEGRNRFGGSTPGPLVVLRLVYRPAGTFDDDQEGDLTREKRLRAAFGVAGAYNYRTNRQNSTYGETFTLGTTSYVHAAADAVVKYAGFSFMGEVLYREANKDILSGAVDGMPVQEWTRSGYGYLAQAGMMLTDVVEVSARWEELFAVAGTDPAFKTLAARQGRQVGGRVSIYLNGHALKIQTDYFHTFGRDPGGTVDMVRTQLDLTI
jgi:hypothetical protein